MRSYIIKAYPTFLDLKSRFVYLQDTAHRASRFLPRRSKSLTDYRLLLTIASLLGLSPSGISLIANLTPSNQFFLTERTLLRHCWDILRAELANRSGLGRR